MSYHISEFGEEVRNDIREFCSRSLAKLLTESDHTGAFPQEVYELASEMELGTLSIPEEYGGMGLGLIDEAAVFEELAHMDAGFTVTYMVNRVAMEPLALFGTEEQKEKCFQALAAGGFGAFCLTESAAGSDILSCRTSAAKTSAGWELTGVKAFVTNGSIADFYIVFAVTDPDAGRKKMSAFLVDRNAPGVSAGADESKMGIRNSVTSEVQFDHVPLTEEDLIGEIGDGFRIATAVLSRSRIWCGVCAVGIAQRAIDEAAGYAREREQFGRPIGTNPVILAKLAEMEIRTEAARHCCEAALTDLAEGRDFAKSSSIAKCISGDAAMFCTEEAVQIFGGNGYCTEYPVEKLMRDAKVFQIFEGTNEIQRQIIGKCVLDRR